MSADQGIVFSIIAAAMVLFVWGKLRYDLVAVAALMFAVLLGVVPADHAFEGFGHPAVITVAAVLIISQSLQNSGIIEHFVRFLAPARKTTTLQVAAGSSLAAALSAVMNNVGALALMLPVSLRDAAKAARSPSLVLMPLSFASLLGGLVTLIGTPPNIVVSAYREQVTGAPYSMFDFTPVGLIIAVAGLAYLSLFGWKLLPLRVDVQNEDSDLAYVSAYSTETKVPEGSPLIGKRVRELETLCEDEISVLAIIRKGVRRLAPRAIEKLREGDILILQGNPAALQPLADGKRLGALGHKIDGKEALRSEDVVIVEAVLLPHSPIEGKTMRSVRLHDRYGINLLAVGRQGQPATARLKNTTFKTGDVLLLQGEAQSMAESLKSLECLPLQDRGLQLKHSGTQVILPVTIFALAIAATAAGLVSAPIAFTCAVIGLIVSSTISLSEAYDSIEWPVILLIAGLIPLGEALQSTGGTTLIADQLLKFAAGSPVWLILAVLMAVSMWLSDMVHNTPTAILMAPIAASIAAGLGSDPDRFLMAVAIGAASPFLTPIGHQSNTLVMSPGGYKFADYARLGAPLQVVILLVGVPALMLVWPGN